MGELVRVIMGDTRRDEKEEKECLVKGTFACGMVCEECVFMSKKMRLQRGVMFLRRTGVS